MWIIFFLESLFILWTFFFFWETAGNSEACERLYAADLKLKATSNGTPLQCSCLENPRDGGAWWAAVYGVAQSPTRLKRLSSSSSSSSVSLPHSFSKYFPASIQLKDTIQSYHSDFLLGEEFWSLNSSRGLKKFSRWIWHPPYPLHLRISALQGGTPLKQ